MTKGGLIRPITLDDAQQVLRIYRPYVENTSISFEYEVPSLDEWVARIEAITSEYPWLVHEHQGKITGYAYGSKHRHRTAYAWSAESTIYMDEEHHRSGIGRILYETLLEVMKLQHYVNVYAAVTIPNVKSEAFHQALGFYEVGVFRKIGFKFGEWHDTRWFQHHLTKHIGPPLTLKTFEEIRHTMGFKSILEKANTKLNQRE
jgi:phosphinothricin acetyltransferase